MGPDCDSDCSDSFKNPFQGDRCLMLVYILPIYTEKQFLVPNYIKISGSLQSQSIRAGNIWIGINDIKKGPTSTTGFYTGITPPNNGYTVYLDKVSGGPSIYVPPSDQNLIALTNLISGGSYSTVDECFNYYASESTKKVFDKYYPTLVTDNIVYLVDAGFTASYPRNGTDVFDLGPNSKPSVLQNGPTWALQGYFNMDGTDDGINVNQNIMSVTQGTVVIWLRTVDDSWMWCKGNNDGAYFLGAVFNNGNWYDSNCGTPTYYIDTVSSSNPYNEGGFDGRFHMFEAKSVNWSGWTIHDFFNYGAGSALAGDVARIAVYDSNLTTDQSLVNYYQSNIPTNGLTVAVDAGNIISYPVTGTSLYNMAPSGTVATLTNGPAYFRGVGGYFSFDGSDDYVIGNATTFGSISGATIIVWFRTTVGQTNKYLVSVPYTSSGSNGFDINFQGSTTFTGFVKTTTGFTQVNYTTTYTDGLWHMGALVFKSGSKVALYYDMVKTESASVVNGTLEVNAGTEYNIGRFGSGGAYCNAEIAVVRIHAEALTPEQIGQAWEAQRSRFNR